MQNNILFFQSTAIGSVENNAGLFELLLAHVDSLELGIFEQLQIIVPNLAVATWLKDQITLKRGICANIDCVVLPGPVLDNIYYANNQGFKAFNFNEAKYIIYEYLCNKRLDDADELNNYIYVNGVLDKYRTYQLSTQLQKIFHEYIYLRTEDLINLESSKIKSWQKEIIWHVLTATAESKTFLDVYKYFTETSISEIKLPKNIMVFGLTSIYPSQLQLLSRLSTVINIYWYHQSSSYKYYGDLLSDRTKAKLEQKLLKKPDLSLDDLYLQDGNPLLANLAQQSREFTELLIANDIDVYTFASGNSKNANTVLQIMQEDIKNMLYRIEPDYRFGNNQDVYSNPIDLSQHILGDAIYDLPSQQTSIKINICHNRMREVQVMFNELVNILNSEPTLKLSDILITAPDIDDYASYITAVFDNESINGEKLLYNITGNRKYKNVRVFETLKILLNAPYVLNVNYFIEVLTQAQIQESFGISLADIDLVKKWLYDNNTHFGYDKQDYTSLGYANYQIHSFKQFINNIVLGACLSDNVYQGNLPLFTTSGHEGANVYIPYDNLDNNQVNLCNSLIILINQLEFLRNKFYLDANNYNELSIGEVHEILNSLNDNYLKEKNSINNFERFLGELLNLPQGLLITLPILDLMLDEYIEDFSSNLSFNGNITCASMRYMRNLPYKKVYVLGLNFGEYPNSYTPNQLSLLAHDWYLADRNYTIEDKQTFLDIILATGEQLFLSYIGRRETDNSEIKPSTVLSLFINTLGQSFTNFKLLSGNSDVTLVGEIKYDFKNLMVQQSLHPFYKNKQTNYSQLWSTIADASLNNNAWDFSQVSPLKIDINKHNQIKIDNLVKVFLYSNTNLYSILGINQFNYELELSDTENINLADRSIARQVESYFKKYAHLGSSRSQLEEYLIANGTLAYEHIGHMQFNYYYELYNKYTVLRGNVKAQIKLSYTISEDIILTLNDEIYLENSTVIVTDNFTNIHNENLVDTIDDLPYGLKIRGLIIYLLCFGGAIITVEDNVCNIEQVIVRQISTSGESRDFILFVDDIASILKQVLRYYVRSLSNPVLIHKGAIIEFAKQKRINKPYSLCVASARSKYMADFENHDLDKIREDIILRSIADNYFEFIDSIHGINDIVKIGEILSSLNP